MAHIDQANLEGRIEKHANISDVAGMGGKNERSDVMLIQALIRLISLDDRYGISFLGVDSQRLPAINGVFDSKTSQAIWAFQRSNVGVLLSVDGRVHPASYKNRIIKPGLKMTITHLNQTAIMYGASALGFDDLITALNAIAPQLFLLPSNPRA